MEAVDPEARRGWPAALAALLTVVTLAVFWPGPDATFLNYDDDLYVTANPSVLAGVTPGGLKWAAGSYHAANWHPLTWLSYMLDVELFGLDAVAHRRTSAVLHALAALLFYLALLAMTRAAGASFFAAALFALHPLRVGSTSARAWPRYSCEGQGPPKPWLFVSRGLSHPAAPAAAPDPSGGWAGCRPSGGPTRPQGNVSVADGIRRGTVSQSLPSS